MTPPGPLRVVIADDNPVVLRGMAAILEVADDIEVVGLAGDGDEALAVVRASRPDVVLLDVQMPGRDGPAVAREVAEDHPVLMITYSDAPEVVADALASGARGYLVHGRFTPEQLVAAVRGTAAGASHLSPQVAAEAVRLAREHLRPLAAGGRFGLTDREIEIMDLVMRGSSNIEIAGRIYLSEKTVKNNLTRVFAKLQARNRAEAVAIYTGRSPDRPS